MTDVEPLQLTASVRQVLAALAGAGSKMDVRDVARAAGVSASTASKALAALVRSRLAQSIPMPEKDKPTRAVFWLNQHGRAVAAPAPGRRT